MEPLRMYFAGFSAAIPKTFLPGYLKMLEKRGYRIRELTSYVECSRGYTWRQLMQTTPQRCEFFLDSGAFSAWSKGTAIDIEAYAQFVLDRPDTFDVIANLDVIPGSWGVVPEQKDIDESAKRGWENYYYLEKKWASIGKKPMHIFHQGEDDKWLDKLIDEAEYFGVSPGNDRTTAQKIDWLDKIMPKLVDKDGWPTRKFHGFGVTSLEILLRYPWYSCDSTSWVLTGRFGAVFVPLRGLGDGKINYHKVTFSDQSPKLGERGGHFKTYDPPEQKAIRAYCEKLGYTPEQLGEDYVARDHMNILFFLELEKNWIPKPFKAKEVQPTFDLGV